ncbi:MAG: nucleotidyltransferase, partial [Bacteroidales bacterium]|nr:nucleotidyltransferase [Bacteroidales bacterium]
MDTVRPNGERISKEQRSLISLRYKRITKAINTEFWDSSSETDHSFYVGSYGRG